MTIDVQRLSLEQEGAIHNYGNLTLVVSSMGADGISSGVSQGKHNVIHNTGRGFMRIVATMEQQSYALLTNHFSFHNGVVLIVGHLNMTDVTATSRSTMSVQAASHLSLYNAHLAGSLHTEEDSQVRIMDGCSLVSLAVAGTGSFVIGGDSTLDSVNVVGDMLVMFGEKDARPVAVTIHGTITFGTSAIVHVVNVHFFATTGFAKLFSYGTNLLDYAHCAFTANMVIQASAVSVIYGNFSEFRLQKPNHFTSLLGPPDSSFYIIDTSSFQQGTDEAAVDAATAESASSLTPAVTTSSIDAFGHRRCEHTFRFAEFVKISGHMFVHGCLSIPVGGLLNGWVRPMRDARDWQALREAVCSPLLLHTPSLCSPTFPIPTPLYSGIVLSGEMLLRRHIELDELRLVAATVRAIDGVVLTLRTGLFVDNASTITFQKGAAITTPLLEISGGGSVAFAALADTFIEGNVSIQPHGVLELMEDTAGCQLDLHLNGSLHVSTEGAVRCVPLLHAESFKAEVSLNKTSDRGRIRLGGLPLDIPCPAGLVKDYVQRRQMLSLFWMSEEAKFSLDEEQLPTAVMLRGVTIALLLSVVLFCGFVRLRGSTLAQWRDDLLMPSPLRLTLTWHELSYSTMNYVCFCTVALTYVQNTLVAFHPSMAAPLPLAGMFSMRSIGVLMPHRLVRVHHANVAYLTTILVSAVTFAVSQRPLKRRPMLMNWHLQILQYVLECLDSGTIFIVGMLSLFHIPIVSFVMDGIACSTLWQDVPSCHEFDNRTTFILAFAAFLSVAVLEPFTVSNMQMRMSRVDLKVKSAWMFLMHNVNILEILLWKVFYGSAGKTAACVGFFHVLYLLLNWVSPPTAYTNINRFLLHMRIFLIIVVATILYHDLRAFRGSISSCTDGDFMFKCVFAVTAIGIFVSFWINVLYARASNESVGDASIDALRRSLAQIRSRIADLKMEVFASGDATDRENTLNAIARLRIEFLEKQERYRYETHRMLRAFYVGAQGADTVAVSAGPSSLLARREYDDFVSAASIAPHSPSSTYSLLTTEEMEIFSCGPALGKGSYGTVYLGILSSGRLVAVKYVNVLNENLEVLESVKAEVDVLKQLSHPNIIRYYGAHMMGDTMLVFMEFAVGGSLTSILRKFSELTEAVMQLYTYQILRGLQYLHYKGVVHRDIKGENILIDGLGVAKLADFGCSKSLANVANGSHVGCGTLVGSPFWMAPEVIRSEAYGTKADIWSVGCTVVEMLNRGEPPWREEFDNVYSAMFYVGSTNDIPQIPEETSDVCRDFLYHCFERDVAKRATADELLRHPWLAAVAASRGNDSVSDLTSLASVLRELAHVADRLLHAFVDILHHHRCPAFRRAPAQRPHGRQDRQAGGRVAPHVDGRHPVGRQQPRGLHRG
ncbi:protein kinase-like protein [Strigomonas culicis]|uniref:Protein kinase-like protein n=1 Tax=Strigomonas culicis TaxID=28005 RepID=S9VHF7_9TRYP|nr:protein kinase-like protein [Strigomonas culicis]|eukprot:EPY22610.1 protein kinase-like protein [Strigomonas culicis]